MNSHKCSMKENENEVKGKNKRCLPFYGSTNNIKKRGKRSQASRIWVSLLKKKKKKKKMSKRFKVCKRICGKVVCKDCNFIFSLMLLHFFAVNQVNSMS